MSGSSLTLIYRFVIVAVLTVALIILDHRTDFFNTSRSALSTINTPLNWVLTTPVRLHEFVTDFWPNEKLRKRVERLQVENQHLHVRAQKYEALEVEKDRLLVLLSASRVRDSQSVRMGRIIRTAMQGAYDQRLVIDRGRRDEVQVSQPVIDANGLIGQISLVARDHAVVTVITDVNHAVPVEVLRNGLNAVARGSGGRKLLSLPFLSFQADVEVGDTLVSSGLGGVFPSGHPVAEIVEIKGIPGEQFLNLYARTFAELDKIKNVLLLEPRNVHDLDDGELEEDKPDLAQHDTDQSGADAQQADEAEVPNAGATHTDGEALEGEPQSPPVQSVEPVEPESSQ